MITHINDNGHVGAESLGDAVSGEFYQGQTNNCAVFSQFRVLKEYGFEGSVDDLIKESFDNGWTNEGGTDIENIGKLLESHGVSCTQVTGANEYRLFSELAQGKQVIVGVDSGELWHGEQEDGNAEADHAITVVGIDTSDRDNPCVIVSDSAHGHIAKPYPLDEFMDAWKDSDCLMIVPNEPPPEEMAVERLANFDYETGHLENFGNLEFETLLELQVCDEEVEVTLEVYASASGIDEDDPFADLDSVEGFGADAEETNEDTEDFEDAEEQFQFDENDPFADLDSIVGFNDSSQKVLGNSAASEEDSNFDEDDPFADLSSIDITDASELSDDEASVFTEGNENEENGNCEDIDNDSVFENLDDEVFSEEYD